jgi:hypothetical protein
VGFSTTITIVLATLLVSVPLSSAAAPLAALSPAERAAFIEQYCSECHNAEDWAGSLAFDQLSVADLHTAPDVWEKVVRKLRVGMMPPQNAKQQPTVALRHAAITSLVSQLDKTAKAKSDPGPYLLRRLNRAEYQNAIRDLLDLEVDAATLLPPDDSAYGFDNNAEALGTSPVLVEQYLSAAGKIASLAVGDIDTGPSAYTFRIRQDASQDIPVQGMPVGTVGGGMLHTVLPLDGEYRLDVTFFKSNLGAMKGLELAHQVEIAVDGERIHSASLGGKEDFTALMQNITEAAAAIEARSSTVAKLSAGPHDFSVGFVYQGATQNSQRLQAFLRSSQDLLDVTGHPHIETLTITGPYKVTGPGDTPSRRRIFSCRPAAPTAEPSAQELSCARDILSRLARQAYRGVVAAKDIDVLLAFFSEGRKRNGFESGIQTAVERLLASPKFTFRIERDPTNAKPNVAHHVSDLELASRLSFFLWSSGPDEELLRLAEQKKLAKPKVLEQQVQRMLADPKARALVDNFAGQWLYLRNLRSMVPNSTGFPNFDDNLRQALLTETELFFQSIVQDDRNVLDLMNADYTYLNERLARHYGIHDVYGNHFRKVQLKDEARWGLLGKGSVQMVTSHTDRTSPIVRGKWVLENLLGAAPPAPPPDVPPLPPDTEGGQVITMRERMQAHSTNPACATCHAMMDPIGFSMDKFDAVGSWREHEAGIDSSRINATGVLLDGTAIDGPIELRQALMQQPEIFVNMLTEKLMIYALGRGTVASDMPEIRKIVRAAEKEEYRFSQLISGVVRSVPFQLRMSAAQEPQVTTTGAERSAHVD